MRTLDRYVAGAVILGTLLVLAVLLAMFTFFATIDELGDVGEGTYSIGDALAHVALTLPQSALEVFPVAALIGTLMSLGALAASSELTVIRAAGVSVARVSGAAMQGGALLMVGALILGELVAPPLAAVADERRARAGAGDAGPGLWSRDGNSFIHIGRIVADERVENVSIFELDEARRLRVSTHAWGATYRDGAWHLEGVRQTEITADGVSTRALPAARWASDLGPALIRVARVEPEQMSARALGRYVRYLEANGQDTAPYAIVLWAKLVTPVTTGVMILLAIPVVFGPLRTASVGSRILVGALVGIGFHVVNQVFMQIGLVYGLPPLLAASAPTLVAGAVALGLLRRVR